MEHYDIQEQEYDLLTTATPSLTVLHTSMISYYMPTRHMDKFRCCGLYTYFTHISCAVVT